MDAMDAVVAVNENDRVVSYLPDAHIANRWGAHYTSLYSGMQITTLADLKQAIAVLPQVRPTFCGAVPQVWYKIKAAIEMALAAEPDAKKRRLAQWAIEVGVRVAKLRSDRRPVPPLLAVQHAVAERLVLVKLRQRLGLDQVRLAATGAAAIAPEALEFILGLGIPCCEGWGMSEVAGLATINPVGQLRIGTVGTAIRHVELRVADDGELLVRGPVLMRGYRNAPEQTAETIDADGWLHTGDVATIDADGYVRIVDRKKELIINASGKNMSPANIENTVRACCAVAGPVIAIGDDRPYIVALVTLDADVLAARGATASDPDVLAEVEAGITAANERLARVEQVKRFTVLADVWEPGGDELTPTMKVKRRPIAQRYAAQIDALYEGSARPTTV
jgi:long-subunit acyl-CoA synthetase (AMP-forming)